MSGFAISKLKTTGLWSIKVGYFSPKLNAAARRVPGMVFDSSVRAHVGYVDAIEQIGKRLREAGLNAPVTPENSREWPHMLPVSYDGARDYQKEGIDFLINQAATGALLADDMGIGKTFQTVRAIRALRRKTVIVAPKHVRGVWESSEDEGGELAKWWPDAKVFAPYGTAPETIPEEANVFVTHYDIVHAWTEAVIEWWSRGGGGTIVFDEAHVLLNPTSRRSKACRDIAYPARGRIALTGTPPTDQIDDLFNIVETISPGRFGGIDKFFSFGLRYCAGQQVEIEKGPEKTKSLVWNFKGASNTAELRERLQWFCLRRTKRQVLKELPAKQRQVVNLEVPMKHRQAVTARMVGDKKQMRAVLDNAADGKFKQVVELIKGHLRGGARVLVGTFRRAVCEKIAAQLQDVAPTSFIHGGIPQVRRNKIIADLRKKEGACCLVATIDCASTGIDLTFASVGVFAELVWEPRELVQFEDRVHRFGQKEPVLWQYTIARGTGDELVLHAVINKLDNFLNLIETDGGDGFKESLEGEEEKGLARLAAALKKMGKKK